MRELAAVHGLTMVIDPLTREELRRAGTDVGRGCVAPDIGALLRMTSAGDYGCAEPGREALFKSMRSAFRLLAALSTAVAVFVPATADAAGWGPAQTVDRGRIASVDVAANDRGEAILAWQDARLKTVRARFRSARGRLGPPRTLSRRSRDAEAPSVAINSRGDAVVAWTESQRSRRRTVWSAVMRKGGRWLPADFLGRSAKSFPQPRAALAASKEAMVVWRYDSRLQAAFRRWGDEFGTPRFVRPAGAHHAVRYDRGSRAWLAYAPYPMPGPARVAVARPGARRFGSPAKVGNAPASWPALADSASGEMGLAYRRSAVPGAEDQAGPIEATIRGVDGTWSRPQVVSPAAFAPAGQSPVALADRPAIAAAWDGTMVVTWLQVTTGENEEIAAAVRPAGEPAFGAAARVGAAFQFTFPTVAIDDARRIAILWRGTADGRIVAAMGEQSGTFGAAQPISAAGAFVWPRVTAGKTLVVAYQEPGRAVVRGWR